MELIEEFSVITNELEKRLAEIFKRVIDTAISEADERKFGPLDKYLYVNNAINNAYRSLAYANGEIDGTNFPYDRTPSLVSDHLMDRIYTYTSPLYDDAQKELQAMVDNIINSETVGELMEKYYKFKMMLDNKGVDPDFYEDVEIKKRV